MQTFLPYEDFAKTASVLDRQRLGKQRVETLQIMKTIALPRSAGWSNHPAVRMWRGYECRLMAYQEAIVAEWISRGYKDTCLGKTVEAHKETCSVARMGERPPWLGDPAFHLSHRSNLLRKDPIHYGPLFPGDPDNLEYVWPA